jgi:hypothetical protein
VASCSFFLLHSTCFLLLLLPSISFLLFLPAFCFLLSSLSWVSPSLLLDLSSLESTFSLVDLKNQLSEQSICVCVFFLSLSLCLRLSLSLSVSLAVTTALCVTSVSCVFLKPYMCGCVRVPLPVCCQPEQDHKHCGPAGRVSEGVLSDRAAGRRRVSHL